jgi:DNA-directed RNA polymerase specialized sigma24 family protein
VDSDVLEKLRKQDWNRLGRLLVLHVCRRSRIRQWREGQEVVLGLGKSPDDIVGDVITKLFAGERTWDPTRGELLPTLQRMVESELDHLWKKHARRRERAEPDDPREREVQEAEALRVDPNVATDDPQAALERAQEASKASARIATLFEAVGGEKALEEVIEAIMEGCEPEPRHLAEYLHVPVKEIYNRLRRLRRKAIEHRHDYEA